MRIERFSKEILAEVISDLLPKNLPYSLVSEKRGASVAYLAAYLEHLGATAIVVEPEYVDAGYLEDYSRYYSRCFHEYSKFTTRLHFLKHVPDNLFDAHVDLLALAKELSDAAYLGFTVIRPLPSRYIGRTCLATYSEDIQRSGAEAGGGGRRKFYPIKRPYRIGLLGREVKVHTVAYQEQDAEVAACATISIWSALHACYKDFAVARIPSPYEITSMATDGLPTTHDLAASVRQFPNDGLSVGQMQACIARLGYMPLIEGLQNRSFLAGDAPIRRRILNHTLSAYLNAGVPVIVVGNVYVGTKNLASTGHQWSWHSGGQHAITALGYSTANAVHGEGFAWAEDRIDRIFAHDDGMGPFVRYEWIDAQNLAGLRDSLTDPEKDRLGRRVLVTYYGDAIADAEQVRCISAQICIVPLNRKMRVGLWSIYSQIESLKEIILQVEKGSRRGEVGWKKRFEWSLKLFDVNSFKKRLLEREEAAEVDSKDKLVWLSASLPKYLWVASLSERNGGHLEIEFVFDGTALNQDRQILGIVHSGRQYDDFISDGVGLLMKEFKAEGKLQDHLRDHLRHFEVGELLMIEYERKEFPPGPELTGQ